MQRIGQKEKRRKIILRHQNLMVTITTKSTYIRIHTYTYKRIFIHAYGYITRAFNRSEERLIHRQRLTSVDRRCSTKFSSLSLFLSLVLSLLFLTFELTTDSIQVDVYIAIGIRSIEREMLYTLAHSLTHLNTMKANEKGHC